MGRGRGRRTRWRSRARSGDCRADSPARGGPLPAADRARAALDGQGSGGGRVELQLCDPRFRSDGCRVSTADSDPMALEDRLPSHPRAQELPLALGLVERLEALGFLIAEDAAGDRDVVGGATRQLDVDAYLAVERDGDEQDVTGVREVEAEAIGRAGSALLSLPRKSRLSVQPLGEAERARLGGGIAG